MVTPSLSRSCSVLVYSYSSMNHCRQQSKPSSAMDKTSKVSETVSPVLTT